jgi:hypothetical protein
LKYKYSSWEDWIVILKPFNSFLEEAKCDILQKAASRSFLSKKDKYSILYNQNIYFHGHKCDVEIYLYRDYDDIPILEDIFYIEDVDCKVRSVTFRFKTSIDLVLNIYRYNSNFDFRIKYNNELIIFSSVWQRNLEPWQDVIAGYNTNILDVIKNRQQIERNTKERIVSKSNNIDVMTITATDTCNSITTRDYFHLKNCSNIGCISFTIKMNDGVKYAYMICHNSFSKAVVDYGTMFRVDTLVEFSSSKELFLDFEKQKILELFS